MPRQNLNVDGKIGGRKCKVRKRGCSSSSSSSLVQNYRLKRAFLVGKRVGSTTPVPKWKMMSSKSPSMENDKAFKYLAAAVKGGDKAKELSVSARKLAATLWEIDGLPSPRLNRKSDVEILRKERILESSRLGSTALVLADLIPSPVSERMDQPKMAAHRRIASACSQKLLTADFDFASAKSQHNLMVEVEHQIQNHARSPCRQITGTKNQLKDVYNGLITSKELLKVMSRVCRLEDQNSTSLSLFSALKFELDRACIHVGKLIQEQRTKGGEIDNLLKRLEEEKMLWKLKEQDRIRRAITSIGGELETERKLRKQTERLNKKLGRELAETKESLTNEKRAREILEQVCDELARGIGEDRAEVEEMKKRSAKVCEEVEKEREMLQLADVLREERVQMKLAEAKYEFEEKNEVVDKLRNELETYLKTKRGEERDNDGSSPNYDKIKELEKYLRETLPNSYEIQNVKTVDIDDDDDVDDDDDEDDDGDDDEDESDLHSIELNMDDLNKSFRWKNGSKRNSVDKKGRKSNSEKLETLEEFDKRGLFEFSSKPWKKDVEEIERYNMIKDLRDHIVSTSKIVPSPSPGRKDPTNGVVCEG